MDTVEKRREDFAKWSHVKCCDFYRVPVGYWLHCPRCVLTPKVWVFNNGEFTACGCANTQYDGFHIKVTPILLYVFDDELDLSTYDKDALRQAWNKSCEEWIAENG